MIGEKTPEDINTICTNFLKYAVTNKEVWITAGICAFIGVLILLARKEMGKVFRKIAVLSLVLYVTYMIGLLGMYLFSMPGISATNLGNFPRYTKTILVAILYLNMVPAVVTISDLPGKRIKTAFMTACVFVSFFVGMYISSGSIKTVVQNTPDASRRNWFENAIATYSIPTGSSYCVLIPSNINSRSYFRVLAAYEFLTPSTAVVIESEDDFNEISQKYVFVYDPDNEIIQNWIQKVYPEQVGNEVIIQPVAKNQ